MANHCDPTNSFLSSLSSIVNTCVPTPLALITSTLGILSIVSWLFAQLPQIIKNYKLKSASGLSIYFLAEWLLGDLTNLLGALLTSQAAWQVVVAAYYVTVDLCLVGQYFWYSHYKPWREKTPSEVDLDCDEHGDGPPREVILGTSLPQGDMPPHQRVQMGRENSDKEPQSPHNLRSTNHGFSIGLKEKAVPNGSYRTIRRPSGSPSPGMSPNTLLVISLVFAVIANASPLRPLLQTSSTTTTTSEKSSSPETAGRILSWFSTLLYLGSRLPQIFKNHRRKSTSGLSPALFIAAFFGNLFYSTSLLTNPLAWSDSPPYGLHGWAGPDGNDRISWIKLAIPFFLGAAGVLIMDAIIGLQFLIFGDEAAAQKVVVVRDDRGRSHWRKVSGWMRGWVPSPGPRAANEDARPLLQRGQSAEQHRYGSL
ncbi:MAG: hypothetical protein Q9219_006856 [cf. Caloplaca sp. 3 TL-2023]